MKDLRNLLVDCRILLRRFPADDRVGEMMSRLESAISRLDAEGFGPPAKPVPPPVTLATDKTEAEQQVAFAWQQAARDLKFSHPELYESLSKRVLDRVGKDALVDQATEIRQLQETAQSASAELQTLRESQAKLQQDYDVLLGSLAQSVPELKDYGDALAVALARIKALIRQRDQAVQKSQQANAAPSAGAEGPKSAASPVPTAELLAEVADGRLPFTKEQREWSVSEAMVVSGFQYTPVELLEKGDAFIAGVLRGAKT